MRRGLDARRARVISKDASLKSMRDLRGPDGRGSAARAGRVMRCAADVAASPPRNSSVFHYQPQLYRHATHARAEHAIPGGGDRARLLTTVAAV